MNSIVLDKPMPLIESPPPDRLDSALCRVAWFLGRRGYSAGSVEIILEHCRAAGSAECCPVLRDRHREQVELLLPRSEAWLDQRWDEVSCVIPGPLVEWYTLTAADVHPA